MSKNLLETMPESHFARVAQSWIRERPDLELRNFLLAMAMMRMGRMIDHAYDKMCAQRFGISGSEMRVLMALRRSGKPFALRPTDLFTALLISSGAISKQVDRLVKKQLVARLEDPTHGGGFLVQLSREGLKVANKAADLLATESLLNPIMARLSPEERDAGEEFCHRVLAGLEAMHVMDSGENTEATRQSAQRVRAVRG
jgi:DNA-binding MarR family transcriptional regulator